MVKKQHAFSPADSTKSRSSELKIKYVYDMYRDT
jgi:hypothetical protein